MNESVTITFQPLTIITWAIIGLIAGGLASWIMRGGARLGGSLFIGLAGALIGGGLFSILNIQVGPPLDTVFPIRLIDILVAFIGSLLVLFIVDRVLRGRR